MSNFDVNSYTALLNTAMGSGYILTLCKNNYLLV